MSESNNILSPVWQKSVVVGTIWGVFEITAGSFIHNLALPFIAGTILSFIGVVIAVTFQAQWRIKGLFWRAGLICAALKSISPSAVLLSPMIAISLEGLLMEIAIRIFGINILGLIVAGGLAVLSVLFFKIVRLIMIYGQGIVDAYNSLFAMAKNQLDIVEGDSWKLILMLAVLYFLSGIIAAIVGIFTSKRVNLSESNISSILHYQNTWDIFHSQSSTKNVVYLTFHIAYLVAFLSLQNLMSPIITFSAGLLYLGWCFILYQKVRIIAKKGGFWVPIVFLSLVIPMISKNLSNYDAITQGLKIFIRALVVIISFAALSVELRSKVFIDYFNKSRLQPLYIASTIAFSSLPNYLSRLRNARIHLKNGRFFSHYIHQLFNGGQSPVNYPVTIIVGDKGSGKTSSIKQLVKYLKTKDIRYCGFYANPIFKDEFRYAFKLVLLPDGEELPLCERENGEKFGEFIFNLDTIRVAEDLIIGTSNDTLIIMDEIGLYELKGIAWANTLSHVLQHNPAVLTVRTEFFNKVVEKWKIHNPRIINAKDFDINKLDVHQ